MAVQNFEIPFDKDGLKYIAKFSTQIKDYSNSLGVSALGVAAAVLREYSAAKSIYPKGNPLFNFYDNLRGWRLRGFSHDTFANDYAGSLRIDPVDIGFFQKVFDQLYAHPDIGDVGPGRIRISVAITQLLRRAAIRGSSPKFI